MCKYGLWLKRAVWHVFYNKTKQECELPMTPSPKGRYKLITALLDCLNI